MQDKVDDIRFPANIFDRIAASSKNQGQKLTYSLDELKASVCQNIEYILNNRSQINILEASSQETRRNFYHLGLSDYSLKNLSDKAVADEFIKEAQMAISTFEPRVKNVSVSFASHEKDKASFHLIISAILDQEGLQEAHLTFNSILTPIKRTFDISVAK